VARTIFFRRQKDSDPKIDYNARACTVRVYRSTPLVSSSMEEQAPIDARYLLSLKVSRGSRKPLANGTIIPYREARKPLRQRNGDHWASKVPLRVVTSNISLPTARSPLTFVCTTKHQIFFCYQPTKRCSKPYFKYILFQNHNSAHLFFAIRWTAMLTSPV
jgi:hypothetical protein